MIILGVKSISSPIKSHRITYLYKNKTLHAKKHSTLTKTSMAIRIKGKNGILSKARRNNEEVAILGLTNWALDHNYSEERKNVTLS